MKYGVLKPKCSYVYGLDEVGQLLHEVGHSLYEVIQLLYEGKQVGQQNLLTVIRGCGKLGTKVDLQSESMKTF